MDAAITQHGMRLIDPTLSLSLPDLFDRFLTATEKSSPLIADGWAAYEHSQQVATSADLEAFRRAARSRDWVERVEKESAKVDALVSKPFTEVEYPVVRDAFRAVCKDVFDEHKALRRFVMGRHMHPKYDEYKPHLAELDKRVQGFAAALDALNVDAHRKVGKPVVDVPKDFRGLPLG